MIKINSISPNLSLIHRLFLAAIHFNHNAGRQQAETISGEKQFRVSYPKFNKGEGVVKPMKNVSYG